MLVEYKIQLLEDMRVVVGRCTPYVVPQVLLLSARHPTKLLRIFVRFPAYSVGRLRNSLAQIHYLSWCVFCVFEFCAKHLATCNYIYMAVCLLSCFKAVYRSYIPIYSTVATSAARGLKGSCRPPLRTFSSYISRRGFLSFIVWRVTPALAIFFVIELDGKTQTNVPSLFTGTQTEVGWHYY